MSFWVSLLTGGLAATVCIGCLLLCRVTGLGGWAQRMARRRLPRLGCVALAGWMAYSSWHASLGTFAFDEALDPGGAIEAALLRRRPLLLFRNRITEPAGFAAESLDFIAALESTYFIAVYNDGRNDRGATRARPLDTRRRLDELLSGKRLGHVQAAPHIQIHLGAAGDFDCPEPERVYCIGRTTFETDRVPRSWVPKINSQHAVWVPSPFNRDTFRASGVSEDKLVVVPEPVDTTLFEPSRYPKGLRGLSGSLPSAAGLDGDLEACRFVFLSLFAWNDRKGWDVLLGAFFGEFERTEGVCLLLRTSPQGSDADHDHSSAIRAKVERFAQQAFARVPMASLPSVHVVGARLATAELPRLYAAADAFVLPSRCGTPAPAPA